MDEDFVKKLTVARHISTVRFRINSGYRCSTHNKAVGGSETSSHLIGLAVDIDCDGTYERFLIIDALIRAGFNRIGISGGFIHVDDDKANSRLRMWVY